MPGNPVVQNTKLPSHTYSSRKLPDLPRSGVTFDPSIEKCRVVLLKYGPEYPAAADAVSTYHTVCSVAPLTVIPFVAI